MNKTRSSLQLDDLLSEKDNLEQELAEDFNFEATGLDAIVHIEWKANKNIRALRAYLSDLRKELANLLNDEIHQLIKVIRDSDVNHRLFHNYIDLSDELIISDSSKNDKELIEARRSLRNQLQNFVDNIQSD